MSNLLNRNGKNIRRKKKLQASCNSSDEICGYQVVETLHGLFKDLGVDVIRSSPNCSTSVKQKLGSHTLYPYASAISELLTCWHQDPAYLDEKGDPAQIKLTGKHPSFRSLAKRSVPMVDESYLLSELERLGAVTIADSKYLRVHMRSFPVYEDRRLAIQHTLKTLDGFMKTLRHNLDSNPSNSEQLFHRIAWNSSFDKREIPALKIRVKRHGQCFLESSDTWLRRKALPKRRKLQAGAQRTRVAVGVYLCIDNP